MTTLTDQQPAAFDQWDLLGRCLGKPELATRVLQKFEKQLGDDLQKIEDALATQDLATAGALAHRIKGAAANVSALALHQQAGALETVLRMSMDDQLDSVWQGLLVERDRFLKVVHETNLAPPHADH